MAGFGYVEEILGQLIAQEPKLAPEASYLSSSLCKRLFSTLKHSKHLQNNQFEVWRRLEGLDETLRIRNNVELADALSIRLKAVKFPKTEWLPEILSLFLHLSNDPANETRIESLDELDREPTPSSPTWQEIFQDDPLDNMDGIWDIPNYGEASSDESEISTPRALPQKLQSRNKEAKENDQVLIDTALDHEAIESSLITDLADAQFWRRRPESSREYIITEIQLIREVLFMLLGLPNSVFCQNHVGSFEPNSSYSLPYVSSEALGGSLFSFARIGNQLSVIRKAIKARSLQSFVQSFQSSLRSQLKAVEKMLNEVQAAIISPPFHESSSLIQVLEKVQLKARPLLKACPVAVLVPISHQQPFAVIEALYDLILHTQSIDDSESYYLAIDLFVDCLSTYLKPISSWMESGTLAMDSDMFFIAKADEAVPLSQLWTEQYQLVNLREGTLRAPRFLHIATRKIFNTGKSIVMLRQLGRNLKGSMNPSIVSLSTLLRSRLTAQPLCPFEEVFATTLDTWIADHYHSYSSTLHTALGTSCGLWSSIDAIEHIYFNRNGHVASQFASLVFARVDTRKARVWHDRFILTDMLRNTFASIQSVETQRLIITIDSPAGKSGSQGSRSVKDLANMSVKYALPWSVSNIIKSSSFIIFQSIFTLLLQIFRAKHLLQQVYHACSASKSRVSREKPIDLRILSLHHRFLWFLDTLHQHLTGTVLLQASAAMHLKLRAAEDVDRMIEVYETFVQHVGTESFVSANTADVRKAIVSILDLVVLFESIGMTGVNARTHKQPRSRTRRQVDGSSVSDESESEEEARATIVPQRRESAADLARLTKIAGTFDRLLQFIIANLAQVQHKATEGSRRSQALLDNLILGVRR